ncbi:metal-dependent hydrolase [Natronomonas sp. EA1]|uniref:metal-dependent hydrolase n=1 Tax=Natronomonas sp. EA1 TaxID=3421655 RepID=UPI003EBDFF40
MPSTVVHVAFAWLLAAGLLRDHFDRRALGLIAAVVVLADLDAFAGLLVESTHRALLHTALLPLAAGALVRWDLRRPDSRIRERYGDWGAEVFPVTVVCFAVAAIGLDLATAGGVNLFYPVYDQFVSVSGELGYATREGFFQTFVEVTGSQAPASGGGGGAGSTQPRIDVGQQGSTREHHVGSGIDPEKGVETGDVRRTFPVFYRGWHLLLTVASLLAVAVRLRDRQPP